MKIALFSDTFSPQINGVANTVKNSARALGELGHEVRVYTISKQNARVLTEAAQGMYRVVVLPSLPTTIYPGERLYFPLGFSLPSVLKFRPDIIHVHTPLAVGLEGVIAAKWLGIPVVGTHHTFFDHYLEHISLDYRWSRRVSWGGTVLFYNRVDLVITPTKALRDELYVYKLKKPVRIVLNSVNTELFSTENVMHETTSEPATSIVYMGRVSYEKNIEDVLRAFVEVLRTIPSSTLTIIGDGPEKQELIELSKKLGIEQRVTFTGFLQGQALVEKVAAGDVFVTASKSENMPLAILEAMSVGLPIVAIASLGMAELIEDNGNGFLVSGQDPSSIPTLLADAVTRILTDTHLRHTFSNHSIELSKKFSEKEVIRELVELYQTAMVAKRLPQ